MEERGRRENLDKNSNPYELHRSTTRRIVDM
jgi:hypothetical protein